MTSTPASTDDGIEVVVGSDGALMVPAAELARHGVNPGAHLRLVVSSSGGSRRGGRSAGSLAHLTSPEGVDAMIKALDEVKAERIAQVTADVS
jgi:hypothetical protein